ncbi:Replication factor C subunit 4 [Thelohanellus kitauei]|uniref:Replication factor C subunit 4 n=1 Tax=Thelohanellus kitauei TaxID=669202 RepID=A0A0C2MSF1_THEKT|nr:Replication factor C subunit 4 [Thelohanellus kitauei]
MSSAQSTLNFNSFFKGGKSMAQSQNAPQREIAIPWIEKYRPKTVGEITSQDEIVLFFKEVLVTGDLPNLMLYGPPGTGKTSSIIAMARDLFGSDQMHSRVLELNASDERGIQVIREKVKTFAQLTVSETSHMVTGKKLPPYKLIVLDEADNMTSSAQAALRRIMESSLSTTRFCLICNYITKIIDPIVSRCTSFYFKPLKVSECLGRLKYIQEKEDLDISEQNLEFLVRFSDGDLRRAIMYLQSCRYFKGEAITMDILSEICGVVPNSYFNKIIETLQNGSFADVCKLSQDFVASGYSITKLVNQILDFTLMSATITDVQKSDILLKLSNVDRILSDGADEFLQVISTLSHIFEVIHTQG